jgi:hypothetical protein
LSGGPAKKEKKKEETREGRNKRRKKQEKEETRDRNPVKINKNKRGKECFSGIFLSVSNCISLLFISLLLNGFYLGSFLRLFCLKAALLRRA